MNRAVILIIIGIILIVGAGYILLKEEIFPPAPISSFDDSKVTKFVRLYLGLANVSVESKEWKNGEWIINATAKGSAGMEILELRADANLTSFKAFVIVNVPNNPPTYQDLYGLNCKSDKSLIDIYVDPYDPWTRAYFDKINNISDMFSDSAVKKFHVVNPYTSKLEGYKWAVTASRYLVCVNKDSNSAFIKSTKCIFNKLNENNNTILNESELDTCVFSSGMTATNETFKSCLDNESIQLLTQDGQYALNQMGEVSTTYVVIDCKYETFPVYLDVVFCHIYPDAPACKEVV